MSLMDPEDEEFGRRAGQDQELVDELEKEGVTQDELPDRAPREGPRPGRKATTDEVEEE